MAEAGSNKRIAKNTLIMYARMAVMMAISLFTARIVFNTLGIENYGIYSLVAGIIVFFSFLNNGLSTATKRYITTEVGKASHEDPAYTFNICIHSHILIIIIVLILAETAGIWFVNNVLNIPAGRYGAANMVYQVSVITTLLSIFQSPYMSVIIAHERMSVFAYFTISDIILKLLVIYLVQILPGDKLVIYSWLILGCCITTFTLYYIYCRRNFIMCQWRRVKDIPLLKEIFKFMSWSILGQVAVVGTNQGVSILINIFYNVTVNAAMGISNTITGIVTSFVSNFQVAFNPQIIKLYGNGEYSSLQTLVFRASKISSYLILLFLIPLCFETDNVLTLWLGDYPQYAPQFAILTLVAIYFDSMSAPLWMVAYSQTKIKTYQICISTVYAMNFFIGWLVLWLGAIPYSVIIIRIIIFVALLFIRLMFVRRFVPSFNYTGWIAQVFIRGLLIAITSFTITYGIDLFFPDDSIWQHIIVITAISVPLTATLIYCLGLDFGERSFVKNILIKKICKKLT